MDLPRAFYTSRVNEALASLAIHVTSARNIAASLKPVLTPDINLVEEETPRPIIVSVEPNKIPMPSSQKFRIRGKNLGKNSDEASFKKIRFFLESDPTISTSPIDLTAVNEPISEFLASVKFSEPGSYEVVLIDKSDIPHLPGFTVEVEEQRSSSDSIFAPTDLTTGGAQVVKPTISTDPVGQTVALGETATFAVEASGTAPINYQWILNGWAIEGAINSTYSIKAVDDNHIGVYTVVVGNPAGFVISEPAQLIIDESTNENQ